MIVEVVEIKKLFDQNNAFEGNVCFDGWVTNVLKGEFSSKEDSTVDLYSLNNWFVYFNNKWLFLCSVTSF